MPRSKSRYETRAHPAVRYSNMSYTSVRPAAQKQKVKRTRTRLLLLLTTAFISFILWPRHQAVPNLPPPGAPGLTKTTKPSFDKKQYPLDKPDSLWWIVSKARPIQPPDYVPVELVNPSVPFRLSPSDEEMRVQKELAPNLEAMFTTARKEGVNLMLISGFRSYAFQSNVYNQTIQQLGEAKANEVSAPPGTSEHQTGLVVDIGSVDRRCEVEVCFGDSAEGKWLAAHAYEYGFNLRYPNGKTTITGYTYEPWHFRYVGKELAAEMQRLNIQTLEEFFAEELKV